MGMKPEFIKKCIERHNDVNDPFQLDNIRSTSGLVFYSARYSYAYDEANESIVAMDKNGTFKGNQYTWTPIDSLDGMSAYNVDPDEYPETLGNFTENDIERMRKAAKGELEPRR